MDTMKYNLQYFNHISFNGFDYVIPEKTLKFISDLSIEVGSSGYIKTPVFKKTDSKVDLNIFTHSSQIASSKNNNSNKKRRGNKGMEVSDEKWEALRTFQPTVIEHKTGIDQQIDQIRLMLNKLTDKTFADISEKIINIIQKLVENNYTEEDMTKIGIFIFDFASTNIFYSKIYAQLYTDLINTYNFLRPVFDKNYASYMELFQVIESGDPDKDYDRFCEINKINQKRKAISMFFLNLFINNIISEQSILEILCNLLNTLLIFINEDNKKNEVDELTENIAILYKKDIADKSNCLVDGVTITDVIKKLAKSKSKDYKSLSNKSIFKYMDLAEM